MLLKSSPRVLKDFEDNMLIHGTPPNYYGRKSVIFADRATNLPRSSILQESFSPRSAAESRQKAVVDGLREES